MHGVGLDEDVRRWFAPEAARSDRTPDAGERRGRRIPKPRVPADLIRRALAGAPLPYPGPAARGEGKRVR